jgi:hypothetical protein
MYSYTPHPIHQFIPTSILLVSAVLAGIFPGWQTALAFVVILIVALATGLWIAAAGTLEKYTRYWENVGADIDKLQKTPPELWGAIGFVVPPQSVVVNSNVTGEEGESPYYATKSFEMPLSPQEMQIFANSVLSGAKTLAESDWKDTQIGQTKARKVKQAMFHAKLIQLKNPLNSLSGFDLNKKGFLYLYQYASEWAKADIHVKIVDSPATPAPSARVNTPQIVD